MVSISCAFNILVSCLLISGINSFLVVKNVPVNSDILRESFLNELQSTIEFEESGNSADQYDAKKCILSLRELGGAGNSHGVQLFDAWGKIPSGLKSYNHYDVGNFDQCIKTKAKISAESIGDVSGQFCFAQLPLANTSLMHSEALQNLDLNIGICVPNSCSPQLVSAILRNGLQKSSNGAISDVSVSQCTEGKRPPLKIIHIFGIIVFSSVILLMVSSTGYEVYVNSTGTQPIPVLLAFSVLTNGRKMFTISTTKTPNSIDCLTGLRVLSMLWIIDHHTHLITTYVPALNNIFYLTWARDSMWAQETFNAAIAVDTFFFMGGLLVAWSGFKELDKTNGKLNAVMMYVHRYIRLTPSVAAVLLFNLSLNELFYTGPFRESVLAKNKCDRTNWWPILLYVQNYIVKPNNCLDETWYLAVDFHLYLTTPLLLILMWKYGKKFAPVLLVLALSSITYVITTFFKQGFTGVIIGTNVGEWTLTNIVTHARIAAWLVGFALGYFMHVNRQTTFQIPKRIQLLAWIGSFTTLFLMVFGPYFIMDDNGHSTNFMAAMYEGWKRILWATSMAWLTFACHYGMGGVVNSFLSHPLWQPLARLSYSLFLVHMTVLRINFGAMRSLVYVSEFVAVQAFWSSVGTSLFYAIILALGFESPILVLEKFIFHKEKTPEKKVN